MTISCMQYHDGVQDVHASSATDLSNNIVCGWIIGDETSQHNGSGVLQPGMRVLHCPHQGLQVGVLLQITINQSGV